MLSYNDTSGCTETTSEYNEHVHPQVLQCLGFQFQGLIGPYSTVVISLSKVIICVSLTVVLFYCYSWCSAEYMYAYVKATHDLFILNIHYIKPALSFLFLASRTLYNSSCIYITLQPV